MSLTSCRISYLPRGDRTLYVTRPVLRSLNLSPGSVITVQAGQRATQATVRVVRKQGNLLLIPTPLRNTLRFPRIGPIQVRSIPGGIRIGPFIGILTNLGPAGSAQPFGSRTELIKQMMRPGRGKGYVFAFTPRDIDWSNDTVRGYFLTPEGGFVRKLVSLPDVVYNRLVSRRAESTAGMDQFKERFIRRGIPLFNWSFFNKSEVYKLLEGEDEAKYVPESYTNPPVSTIRDLLERHRLAYLKPIGGSLGKGIFRLSYAPGQGYYVRFRRGGKNALLRYSRFSSLNQMLNRNGRLKNYVLQQGIRLVELDDCPLDFRFHLNKNESGRWAISGIGAKKAGKGSVTTHIKNGGKLYTPEYALTRVFGSRAGHILEQMKRAALDLADRIDRNYPHTIGEIGFDLGVDRDENVWMFEANAKPGRSIFKHPALKEEGLDTFRNVIGYCMYLSDFASGAD